MYCPQSSKSFPAVLSQIEKRQLVIQHSSEIGATFPIGASHMALDSKASLSAARGDGRPALLTGSRLQRTAALLGDADDAEPVAATRFKTDKAA
jgi:hypothetical protein